MTLKVKSTNLSLLRDIIEGRYDAALQNENLTITNGFVSALAEFEVTNSKSGKILNYNIAHKKYRSKRKNRNLEYYLEGSSDPTLDWLKEKKRLSEKKKKDLRRQRKDARSEEMKEKENKHFREQLARDAYDLWLKETRKTCKSQTNGTVEEENLSTAKKVPAMRGSLGVQRKKERESTKEEGSRLTGTTRPPNTRPLTAKPTIKGPSAQRTEGAANSHSERPYCIMTDGREKSFQESKKSHKEAAKASPDKEEVDQQIKDIVRNLRREKMKEKERSKLRVDSGIMLKREKMGKIEINKEPGEFVWRFLDGSDKEVERTELRRVSNSRARHADRINHEHANPFSERPLDEGTIKPLEPSSPWS